MTVSGLMIASAARTSGNNQERPTKINRSVLLKAGLLGPIRRRTLICWRSTRFSTSSAALERNNPTSAHQISLQTSLIAHSINRFALARHWVRFAVGPGVRSLVRTWAQELKDKGIRVNTLSPGATETPIIRGQFDSDEASDAAKQAFASMTPLGRIGQPEELAAAALFLASNESSYVTGIDLPVDGGLAQV